VLRYVLTHHKGQREVLVRSGTEWCNGMFGGYQVFYDVDEFMCGWGGEETA
jgi:hypothetical protein